MAAQGIKATTGIKGILFDCFGVLYVGSLSELYDLTPRDRWEDLHDLAIGSDYGYIPREDYLRAVAGLTGLSYEQIQKQQSRAHVRNEALIEYIRDLHATYKIGLLSNVGFDLIESLFSEQERNSLFDTVVLSSTEGIVKPHPKIFQIAAERLGLDPGDCLMVDDLQKNIDGADAAGMRGIVYTGLDAFKAELTSVLSV